MTGKIILKAEKRSVTGKKVKSLRREGIVPANVFGKNIESVSIQIKENEFDKVYKSAGETQIIDLWVGKVQKPVLISNISSDPRTDKPLHVDFMQIDLKKKLVAEVPIELIGESPAEKQGLGTAVQHLNELEIEALPGQFPDKVEVDLSNLKDVDQAIMVKDLKLDGDLNIKNDKDQIIVKVEPLRKEEEVQPPAPVEGEETPSEEGVQAEGEKTSPDETQPVPEVEKQQG